MEFNFNKGDKVIISKSDGIREDCLNTVFEFWTKYESGCELKAFNPIDQKKYSVARGQMITHTADVPLERYYEKEDFYITL